MKEATVFPSSSEQTFPGVAGWDTGAEFISSTSETSKEGLVRAQNFRISKTNKQK